MLTSWARRFLVLMLTICLAAAFASPSAADELNIPDAPDPEVAGVRDIVFPVAGEPVFWDDWHAPRDNGERLHLGNDIAAPKLTPALAAVDGTVAWISRTSEGTAGNYVFIVDADGWQYAYLHLNNDSPTTDDNTNPAGWGIAEGIEVGSPVVAGQLIGFVGDSGNAETSPAHLHFEIRTPLGEPVNPYWSLLKASLDTTTRRCVDSHTDPRTIPSPTRHPRLIVTSSGGVVPIDGAIQYGDLLGFDLDAPIVAAAMTPSGLGYWLLGADGGVFAFGDAEFHGSLRSFEGEPINLAAILEKRESLEFANKIRAVDIIAGPDRSQYWVAVENGTVIEFGGSDRKLRPPVQLVSPVVGVYSVPDGPGTWVLSEDGGVFALAGAPYHGSLPALDVAHSRAVAMLTSDSDNGYGIIDEDGSVFGFGALTDHVEQAEFDRCDLVGVTQAVAAGPGSYQILTGQGRVTGIGGIGSPLDDIAIVDAVDILAPHRPWGDVQLDIEVLTEPR